MSERDLDYWKQRSLHFEKETRQLRPVVNAVRVLKYSANAKEHKVALRKLYAALDAMDKAND